jgi:hypothetical protein
MDGPKPKIKFKREIRRRRYQSAWITTAPGRMATECCLTNLSQGGAQIIIGAGIDLPSSFTITLVPNTDQQKTCEVVWRRGNTVGLRFVQYD